VFAVLEWEEPPRSILGRVLGRLRGQNIYYARLQVMGAPYLLLRATARADALPNWSILQQACGRYADRVLLPDNGIVLPQESGLAKAKLPAFEKQVLVSTACSAIAGTKSPMYRRILGLVDAAGHFADQLQELLKYYTCVKVLTHAMERYLQESRRMMDRFGAPVIVSNEPGVLRDCVAILAPNPADMTGVPRAPVPVIAGGNAPLCCPHDWVSHLRIVPPTPVQEACPRGVDSQAFSGALYEFSGLQKQNFAAAQMRYQGRECSFPELVSRLSMSVQLIPALNYS
jgi:hypothetical protein